METKDLPHGKKSTYDNHRCRCDLCKKAKQEYQQRWYSINADRVKENSRRWHKKNSARKSTRNREWRESNADHRRDYQLRAKYRVSLEEYRSMCEDQHGVCAICGRPEIAVDKRTGRIKPLSVDHCHRTGEVRGLLCESCNLTIGKCGDNYVILRLAASYLERHTPRSENALPLEEEQGASH